MKKKFSTDRLSINPLSSNESDFILELVNTEGWISFIGNRNIHNEEDSILYIKKIIKNPDIKYFTVRLRSSNDPIGIITVIKRDYLEYRDIGFAFLPEFFSKGYAFEAAKSVLDELLKSNEHLQATTVPENSSSVRLLKKLGMKFDKEIVPENKKLCVYIL